MSRGATVRSAMPTLRGRCCTPFPTNRSTSPAPTKRRAAPSYFSIEEHVMTQTPSTDLVPIEEAATGEPGHVFAFGDPESVLDRRELSQYFEIWHNGRWFEPPLPVGKLAQAFNMSPYHRSAIALKV